jgi:hypothetical protein
MSRLVDVFRSEKMGDLLLGLDRPGDKKAILWCESSLCRAVTLPS